MQCFMSAEGTAGQPIGTFNVAFTFKLGLALLGGEMPKMIDSCKSNDDDSMSESERELPLTSDKEG